MSSTSVDISVNIEEARPPDIAKTSNLDLENTRPLLTVKTRPLFMTKSSIIDTADSSAEDLSSLESEEKPARFGSENARNTPFFFAGNDSSHAAKKYLSPGVVFVDYNPTSGLVRHSSSELVNNVIFGTANKSASGLIKDSSSAIVRISLSGSKENLSSGRLVKHSSSELVNNALFGNANKSAPGLINDSSSGIVRAGISLFGSKENLSPSEVKTVSSPITHARRPSGGDAWKPPDTSKRPPDDHTEKPLDTPEKPPQAPSMKFDSIDELYEYLFDPSDNYNVDDFQSDLFDTIEEDSNIHTSFDQKSTNDLYDDSSETFEVEPYINICINTQFDKKRVNIYDESPYTVEVEPYLQEGISSRHSGKKRLSDNLNSTKVTRVHTEPKPTSNEKRVYCFYANRSSAKSTNDLYDDSSETFEVEPYMNIGMNIQLDKNSVNIYAESPDTMEAEPYLQEGSSHHSGKKPIDRLYTETPFIRDIINDQDGKECLYNPSLHCEWPTTPWSEAKLRLAKDLPAKNSVFNNTKQARAKRDHEQDEGCLASLPRHRNSLEWSDVSMPLEDRHSPGVKGDYNM